MEKISNQQIPLWDRPSHTRGHLSSVDKAVAAHRSRVDARQMRTQNRLDASRVINNSFFATPENLAPLAAQQDPNMPSEVINDPALGLQPIVGNLVEAETTEALPMGMDEFYTEISASPVRALAPQILAADTVGEGIPEDQSDEVPKGTYVDYTV